MSKLKKLIDKHCSNGVEYRKLSELLDYEQPTRYIVKSTEYDNSYVTPVLTAGQTFILGYTNEEDGIYIADKNNPTIIFDDFTTSFHWVDFNFKVKSSAMKMLRPNDTFEGSFRYVYYAMKCILFEATDHTRHWISKYSQFEIPFPPLEVQEEIVKILDRFAEYAAELQAELQARQEQYEHYRNKLLIFNNINGGGYASVTWMKMSEIGAFVRGNGLQKKDFTERGVPCIHYGQIYTHYGTFATQTKSFVNEETAKKCKKAHTGDLVFATVSENIDDVCKCVAWLGDEEICISGDSLAFCHNQNPKYLAYYFQTTAFADYKRSKVTGTKVIRLHQSKLEQFVIPIPSLVEQERIVSILDKFETLVNDLSKGLPAEIAAVQEQYEYYRNKLLSFPKYKLSA
mgnify:CR=1 FL=1